MTESELLTLISQNKDMMFVLRKIAELDLNDSWLAAGAVRNFIWNTLSGRSAFDRETDMDVVFFDRKKSYQETLAIEQKLLTDYPDYCWEVRNQVHMHQHSPNTKPYISSCDAISKYPERCTAVAVRLVNNHLELFAPYGLDDILTFTVKPTPHFMANPNRFEVYKKRMAKKTWAQSWPQLQILEK
ncbi:nucleotidyltransferase family protein [Streptococcus porci]|uniref:nucleotidyltransferase family protein n=1 Tax=Streptococcus porci TaxID=502567 RepID=UPI000486F156|nr:nucleotidyltransferase family protein [Streptococcus porci]